MSYEFYKALHLMGLVLAVLGIGGIVFATLSGTQLKTWVRVTAFSAHGLGLFLVLLGGFGMLARLGLAREMPVWVYYKLAIWAFFALAVSLARRVRGGALAVFFLAVILAGLAQWIAVNKPQL